jgi:hypothetical protein
MKKATPRVHHQRWYVEPLNTKSNKRIAEYLGREEDECPRQRCGDGQEHDLWECDNYGQVDYLDKSQSQIEGLCFRPWTQHDNGKIMPWIFLRSSSRIKRSDRNAAGQPLLFKASELLPV